MCLKLLMLGEISEIVNGSISPVNGWELEPGQLDHPAKILIEWPSSRVTCSFSVVCERWSRPAAYRSFSPSLYMYLMAGL
jgi:hypothetical protein